MKQPFSASEKTARKHKKLPKHPDRTERKMKNSQSFSVTFSRTYKMMRFSQVYTTYFLKQSTPPNKQPTSEKI
jgi:hypothetical protein